MKGLVGRAALVVTVTMLVFVPAASAADEVTATVTYVTASTVYLGAGADAGLRVGDELALTRDGTVVATVAVVELSSRRAACRIASQERTPAIGDVVHFVPATADSPAESSAQAAGADPVGDIAENGSVPGSAPTARHDPVRTKPARGTGIHGYVGLRYLFVENRATGTGYSSPALDMRLRGRQIGGSPWAFGFDLRTRRTYRHEPEGSSADSRTRLYRMALEWAPSAPLQLVAGRHSVPALAVVSIFDGVSFSYRKRRWALGGFAGLQPDIADFAPSTRVREHGVYFELTAGPDTPRRWRFSTGLIGSYEDSEVNREFLYLQGRYVGPRLSAFLSQEVDFNRGWKADEGADTISPTSLFARVSYRPIRTVELHGGYDNRRNVRLYRDRVTPITEFDDAFRRGLWVGTSLTFATRLRLGLDAHGSTREGAGDAGSYSATLSAAGLAGGRLNLRARTTRYENDRLDGWLYALDLSAPVSSRVNVGLSAGLRDDRYASTLVPANSVFWYGFDLDAQIAGRWYLMASFERTDGDREQVDQLYSGLTWRF